MYNNKLVYKVDILVFGGIGLWKEKESLILVKQKHIWPHPLQDYEQVQLQPPPPPQPHMHWKIISKSSIYWESQIFFYKVIFCFFFYYGDYGVNTH